MQFVVAKERGENERRRFNPRRKTVELKEQILGFIIYRKYYTSQRERENQFSIRERDENRNKAEEKTHVGYPSRNKGFSCSRRRVEL